MRPSDIEKSVKKLRYSSSTESRSRVLGNILQALDKSQKTSAVIQPNIWRIIMKSKITKYAAAAVIIIAISFLGLFSNQSDSTDQIKTISCFNLLSQVCAAEQALFYQDGIAHIINEIIVYPVPDSSEQSDRAEDKSQWQKNVDTINSFVKYNWLPMCSLKPTGQFRFNQLELWSDSDKPYTIVDESWYDSSTGYFARILKLDEQVIFANSYDGQFVYSAETEPNGTFRVIDEQIADSFTAPQNPAEFLGLTAGLRSGIEETDALIQGISDGTLSDGTAVSIVKIGFANLYGEIEAYWLFRIREDDHTTAEMEFTIADQSRLLIRRVLSETVSQPELSWNLAEVEDRITDSQEVDKKVAIKPDMVIPDVTVKHMVERASSETYIFASNHPWANHREIIDCIDPPSPGHRMFCIAYRADDGRHIVMVQSHTYNKMLGNFAKMGELVYESPNGFKAWGGGPYKWWTEILLSSARSTIKDPPSEDRIGYVLESPAGTFPSLAINGPLTDEELHNLIDSLVPAKEYIGE